MGKKPPGEIRPDSRAARPEASLDDPARRIRVSSGGASPARLSVEEARHPETDRHAKIQNAYLRGIEEGPRRPGGPIVGLAPQQAESGGRALPRPEGPLRDHAARGPARRPVRGRDGPPTPRRRSSGSTGRSPLRPTENVNPKLETGEVEVEIEAFEVLGGADPLPFSIFPEEDAPEDTRLRYRYLDLRRSQMHRNIVLRSQIIASIRRRMTEQGFNEFQTPTLTVSSPEGARDYLVPSRLHPGKFYALPQAPQQFKQLLMVAGFDRYFQVAPCYRDEDARADRSPGEFYQLDIEMSFVTQDELFAVIEEVMEGLFREFAPGWTITEAPFPRIPFEEAMRKYGSDKPDLRIPLEIRDVSDLFRGELLPGVRRQDGPRPRGPRMLGPPAVVLRPDRGQGQGGGRRGPGLARGPGGRDVQGPDREVPQRGDRRRPPRRHRGGRRPCRLPHGRRRRGPRLQGHGRVEDPPGEPAGDGGGERLPLLLDHRLPDVREGRGPPGRSPSATTRSRCRRGAWTR